MTLPMPMPISNDDDDDVPTLRNPTTIDIEDVPTRRQVPSLHRRYRPLGPMPKPPPRSIRLAAKVAVLVGAASMFSTFGCGSEDDSSDPSATEPAPRPSARNAAGNGSGGGSGTNGKTAATSPDEPAPVEPAAPPATEPPAQPVTDPCAGSIPVHSFSDETNAWRYSLDSTPPPGFTYRGIAFRLPAPSTADSDRELYFLANVESGDYLVSQRFDEAVDLGYVLVASLGRGWSKPHAGSVALVRLLQGTPRLRHRAEIENGVIPDGWEMEPPRGYVCPS